VRLSLRKFILSVSVLAGFLFSSLGNAQAPVDYTALIGRITSDPLVFAKFHRALVLTYLNEDRSFVNTKDYFLKKRTSQTGKSFGLRTLDFMTSLLLAEAMAADLSGEVCFFGGWPSVRIDGLCKRPWSDEVKAHSGMSEFEKGYQENGNCDSKSNNNFEYRTCNPILFGPGGTRSNVIEEGMCVSLPKVRGQTDYSNFTKTCFDNAKLNFRRLGSLNNLQALYERVRNDEDFREEYKKHAEAILSFCQSNPRQNGNTCASLLAIASPAMNMMCMTIGDNVTRSQLDEISSLWNSMRNELVDIDWVSAERMDDDIARMTHAVTTRAPASSGDEIDWEGEIPETAEGMDAVAAWAKRLATKRCTGQSISSCTGSKAASKPTGYCWRHVKLALQRGGAVDEYIPSVNAFDAHNHGLLERRGFCNVSTNASEAPINSILVYERTDRRSGNPGHIEIKTGQNEFVSDFITDKPISDYNSKRKLVGAYIPCGDQ
jgi:hypothetical protein